MELQRQFGGCPATVRKGKESPPASPSGVMFCVCGVVQVSAPDAHIRKPSASLLMAKTEWSREPSPMHQMRPNFAESRDQLATQLTTGNRQKATSKKALCCRCPAPHRGAVAPLRAALLCNVHCQGVFRIIKNQGRKPLPPKPLLPLPPPTCSKDTLPTAHCRYVLRAGRGGVVSSRVQFAPLMLCTGIPCLCAPQRATEVTWSWRNAGTAIALCRSTPLPPAPSLLPAAYCSG